MSLQKIWNKIAIVLLLIAYFFLKCNYLDTVPRWDAATYWGALTTAVTATLSMTHWTELPQTILNSYNAFGHPSMGYFGLLVLGQLHDFPSLFMLNMINVLLSTLSVFSVYKIFRWFLSDDKYLPEVLIATAAYALEPLFFGCSIFINTDFPVLVFFTVSIACLLYGKYGCFVIASLFMIFSKETGAMYWAATVGGVFLTSSLIFIYGLKSRTRVSLSQLLPPFQNNKANQHYIILRNIYAFICLLLPGILFKVFTIAQRGAMWSEGTGLKFDSQGWNCFGFNTRVMLNRAGEMFVLDFHWIPCLIIVVASLVGLGRFIEAKSINNINNKTITTSKNYLTLHPNWAAIPIVTSFLAFVAFNLTYITYIIPRYVINGGFFLVIFSVLSLHFAIKSQKIRLFILALMFILFAIQTFRTIDPLSKLVFGSSAFNNHQLLQIDNPAEAVGNAFAYNSEFTSIDKLYNLMQKAIPLKADTQIITWSRDRWYSWFYVNIKTLERTVDWRDAYNYNLIDIGELQNTQLPSSAIYVYMPWLSALSNEAVELAQLQSFYQISEVTEVGYQGYTIRFYRLTRLTQ